MTRPPFPNVIDSSLMSAFRACPRKFELEYLRHYKPGQNSVHLIAGGAFASGLEALRKAFYVEGKSSEESLNLGRNALIKAYGSFQCPPDSAKSLERTLGALDFYVQSYPLETDAVTPAKLPGDVSGIEFSFCEPLDILHPETGDPLLYCGRFDMIAEYAGGLYGFDDKTTSSLGASWSKQWQLRSQFSAYSWGAKRAGIKLNGFLVRGVSILKTKYDTQQVLTYRPDWMLDLWYENLLRSLKNMIGQWQSGVFDQNFDHACVDFGGCPFMQVCLSKDPDPWLKGSFVRREWSPLTRTETILEAEE